MILKTKFLKDEYFWGGDAANGPEMPIYEGVKYSRDFAFSCTTQCMPMLLSSKGRYIWSERGLKISVDGDELIVESDSDIELNEDGDSLRQAYLNAMEAHFPFEKTRRNGFKLPREFFKSAQFNCWVEFNYEPTQEGILEYAHAIIDNGFEPGILMIDEGWHTRYGQWKFDFHKFPDPKAMVDELHSLGFIVMLWVTPMVTPDGVDFCKDTRDLFNPESYDKLFLRNKEGKVALIEWWNGYSAILDLRKDCDKKYLSSKLDFLMQEYGIDGFKFDGGSYDMYSKSAMQNGTPRDDHDQIELNIAWNEFGAKYKYHEYKDTFKGGGKPTIQRMWDREHLWEAPSGMASIIPGSFIQGLFGHPFICPDMIGGGSWTDSSDLVPNFKIDEELFIRWTQLSSMFPMMQFSRAPWKWLSKDAFALVKGAYDHHMKFIDEIMELVSNAEMTGEPILRNLEYNDPNQGFAKITDEYMLGTDLLVCPVITKGARERVVHFPSGRWIDEDGAIYEGRSSKTLSAPLDKLLWFRRVK